MGKGKARRGEGCSRSSRPFFSFFIRFFSESTGREGSNGSPPPDTDCLITRRPTFLCKSPPAGSGIPSGSSGCLPAHSGRSCVISWRSFTRRISPEPATGLLEAIGRSAAPRAGAVQDLVDLPGSGPPGGRSDGPAEGRAHRRRCSRRPPGGPALGRRASPWRHEGVIAGRTARAAAGRPPGPPLVGAGPAAVDAGQPP
jgi:hypothetical protein